MFTLTIYAHDVIVFILVNANTGTIFFIRGLQIASFPKKEKRKANTLSRFFTIVYYQHTSIHHFKGLKTSIRKRKKTIRFMIYSLLARYTSTGYFDEIRTNLLIEYLNKVTKSD